MQKKKILNFIRADLYHMILYMKKVVILCFLVFSEPKILKLHFPDARDWSAVELLTLLEGDYSAVYRIYGKP